MTTAATQESADAECPLDLSGWEPDAVIARWRAAHILDRGMERRALRYERGWLVAG